MTEPLISVSRSQDAPEVTIVTFSGVMGVSCIGALSAAFEKMASEGAVFVIADMARVAALSSAAIGELMGGRKVLLDQGGELVLTRLTIDLRTKLTLMGAHKVFRFYNDIRSATNAFEWEFKGKPEEITLSFPPFLKFVPAVRQLASRIARQKGYNRRDSFRIETIVDEICNNAVEHGRNDNGSSIQLKVIVNRSKMEITVVNSSNPERVPNLKAFVNARDLPAEAVSDKVRGRGLSLIKLLSSELDIDFSEEGTSVRATKLREE